MLVRGDLVVKFPADRVAGLMESGDGRPFDPGHGRVMKEWVALRPADESTCEDYVREARVFVAAQTKPA
jgi:hypothetical protein